MGEPSGIEPWQRAVEARVEQAAADAAAARHLAAAHDRDIADLGVKVDANRRAINALGEQTAARFDGLERRFDGLEGRVDQLERKVDHGFTEMRGRLDAAAAGQERIVGLLDRLLDDRDR